MKYVVLAAIALASSPVQAQDAENVHQDVEDVARAYWHARTLARLAGNRACSIADFPPYEDPASPFRRNDERMRRIEAALGALQSGVIAASRPRTPFPPSQTLCDDAADARRALDEYDAQISTIEQRLDLIVNGAG
ncbi:MAG: hypothetical protein ABIT10_04915 [Alteraurantiacibacter sp.]